MVEKEYIAPIKESLKSLQFKHFKPELLVNLSQWEAMTIEPNRRWFFTHKEFNTEKNQYILEVYKPTESIKGTAEVPRVSLMISNESALFTVTLLEARSFSFGRVGIERAGEQEIVRFKGLNNSSFEIRNDGSYRAKNADDSFLIPFSSK